jgi:hypothetical protein
MAQTLLANPTKKLIESYGGRDLVSRERLLMTALDMRNRRGWRYEHAAGNHHRIVAWRCSCSAVVHHRRGRRDRRGVVDRSSRRVLLVGVGFLCRMEVSRMNILMETFVAYRARRSTRLSRTSEVH